MKVNLDGKEVMVDFLGGFRIDELEKEYALCSYDDGEDKDNVLVAILEIDYDYNGEEVLVSIPDEEKEIVLNFYNAFKNSILEGGNE